MHTLGLPQAEEALALAAGDASPRARVVTAMACRALGLALRESSDYKASAWVQAPKGGRWGQRVGGNCRGGGHGGQRVGAGTQARPPGARTAPSQLLLLAPSGLPAPQSRGTLLRPSSSCYDLLGCLLWLLSPSPTKPRTDPHAPLPALPLPSLPLPPCSAAMQEGRVAIAALPQLDKHAWVEHILLTAE